MSENPSEQIISHVSWKDVAPTYLTAAPDYRCIGVGGKRSLMRVQLNATPKGRHARQDYWVHFDYDYAVWKIAAYLKRRLHPANDEELARLAHSVGFTLEGMREDEF